MAEAELQQSQAKARPVGASTGVGEFSIPDLLPSFERHLRSLNRSDLTVRDYLRDAKCLDDWLARKQMPTAVGRITREYIEAYFVAELQRVSANTVASAYRRLKQLFRWLREDGEIPADPMANMRPPEVGESPVPVVDIEVVQALLHVCEGTEFRQRRDTAIIRFLLDNGGRRAEVAGLALADVDLSRNIARVTGKGRGGGKERDLPFGTKAAAAIDRYLRSRTRHPQASLPWLWLGQRGRFGYWGIGQMLEARAAEAKVEHVHPHLFRHLFSHRWLANGGNEGDLMRINGWSSRDMLDRYAKSAADERAREAHRRMGLGDEV